MAIGTLPPRAAAPQRFAGRRLDLDDGRAGHRQQEAGIGSLVDLAEVEHDDAVERARRPGHAVLPPFFVPPKG
jgi:hypothetical protein